MALLTSSKIAELNDAFNELNNFIRSYAYDIIHEDNMDTNIRSFTCERIIHALMEVAKTIDGAHALFHQYLHLGDFISNPISKQLIDATFVHLSQDPLVPAAPYTDVRTLFTAYCYLVCIVIKGIDAYKKKCMKEVVFCIDLEEKVREMHQPVA